jgi:aryl-alcohol dehydrogenase-like predicted oxidoreductase
MAAGLLTGKYEKGKAPLEGARFSLAKWGYTYNQKYWDELNFAAVGQLGKIAAGRGRSLSQFALAWVLNTPGITAIVNGATSMGQLEENLGAVEIKLSREEMEACDEVWHMLRPPRLFYGR